MLNISPQYQPGLYTIKFMMNLDRSIQAANPQRYVQSLQNVLGPSVEFMGPNAVEIDIIMHRIGSNTISGVLRVRIRAVQPMNSIGDAIYRAIRAVTPEATYYYDYSTLGYAAALPGVAWAFAPAFALFASTRPAREAVTSRVFPPMIVTETLSGIVPSAAPNTSNTLPGAVASLGATRVSTNSSRTGNVTASDVRATVSGVQTALSDTLAISTGTAVAISLASAAVLVIVGVVVYKKYS